MILTSRIQFVFFLTGFIGLLLISVPGNIEMGEFFLANYDMDSAFRYFSDARKGKKKNLGALKNLKNYYLLQGDTSRALELQEALVKLRPQNPDYWDELRKLYDWNHRPLESLRAREERTKFLPEKDREREYAQIAEGFHWLRSWEDADRVYLLLQKSTEPVIRGNVINYFFTRRRPEVVEGLIAGNRDETTYRRWLAEIAEARGDMNLALQRWREAIRNDFHEDKLEARDREILQREGFALNRVLALREKIEKGSSLPILEKLETFLDNSGNLRLNLAYEYLGTGDRESARNIFLTLEGSDLVPEDRFSVCGALRELGELDHSTSCFKNLLKRHPRNIRYLEAYGDLLEFRGEKSRALEVFEKILRLQGEGDFTLLNLSELTRVVQVGGEVIPKAQERSQHRLPETTLDRYRERVIFLREETGKGKKNEALLRKLVERHPRNALHLKALGFYYLDYGDRKKGVEIFRKVLTILPDDPEANRIVLSDDLERGKVDEVYQRLSTLPQETPADYEFRHEVLIRAGKTGEARDLCLSHGEASPRLSILCEREFGDREIAWSKLDELIKKGPDRDLETLRISWALEDEDADVAESGIEELRRRGQFTNANAEQEKNLEELKKILARRVALTFRHIQTHAFIPQNEFHLTELELWKRSRKVGGGLHLEHLLASSSWLRVTPFLSLHKDASSLKLGPSLTFGDKHPGVGILAEATHSFSDQLFGSLRVETRRPEYLLRDLDREDKAYQSLITLYLGKSVPEKSQTDFAVTTNEYTFDKESGRDLQIFSEHRRKHREHFLYGARVFGAKLSDSAGDNVKSLHIEEALSYYIVLGASDDPLDSRPDKGWRWLVQGAVGGDALRGIGFGKSLNARGELGYDWNPDARAFLFFEYTKESFITLVNELRLMGISITGHF